MARGLLLQVPHDDEIGPGGGQSQTHRNIFGTYSHGAAAHNAAGKSRILILNYEKTRNASDAFYFRPTRSPIGARKRTRSRARMTTPATSAATSATSAATSAGEARPDGFGSDLGVCWPPSQSHRSIGFRDKEATLERDLFQRSVRTGQFQSEK